MSFYLIDHPPAQRQFRERGTTPSGVFVIHTAESTPDWVNEDAGAEAVARFIQGRSDYGSYHTIVDSDSIVPLVPPHLQAYGDGTGSNPHACHVSAATQAAKWNQAPVEWRVECARNMGEAAARIARWLEKEHGIVVPAKRITRDESERRVPGFISHGERDPGRRTDPGKDFPWGEFFDAYREALNPEAPTPNITAAFQAKALPERRAALRRVVRRGSPEAQKAAEVWLKGIANRERGRVQIERGMTALKALQVKE